LIIQLNYINRVKSITEIAETFNRRSISNDKREIIELAMNEMRNEIINEILLSSDYGMMFSEKQRLIRDIKNIKIW